MPGKFIVLYGISHLLKMNFAKRLVAYFRQTGRGAEYIKYPIYSVSPSGFYIDNVMKANMKVSEEELQIWFALNRYQYQPILQKMLDEGKHVIAEDYTGTAIAWGSCRGADPSWLESINVKLRKEDLPIFLDGNRFSGANEFSYGDSHLIEKVRNKFLEIAKEKKWRVINANKNLEDIFSDVLKIINTEA